MRDVFCLATMPVTPTRSGLLHPDHVRGLNVGLACHGDGAKPKPISLTPQEPYGITTPCSRQESEGTEQ
ncbi:hypothetical protein [Rhodopirellula sp. MGV]|uniref:hypothetical protein n=1 Tax=Rhodopirellula sp. MGV TaxID=2023130 RepID=UPI000B95DA2D|nr:hypothetical protein [Rhodopirellula sp. MGV]OYP34714.1 hypothetical protein CGZ80_13860 [Rhodopirellula sp. MGV]PNY34331.1 hypothetical protein C2E31_24195 [Rhodopirellula baltica]